MREFVTLDDKLAREVKKAGVQMSDQTRIELVEEKTSSSALEAMEKYKDMKVTLRQLDACDKVRIRRLACLFEHIDASMLRDGL